MSSYWYTSIGQCRSGSCTILLLWLITENCSATSVNNSRVQPPTEQLLACLTLVIHLLILCQLPSDQHKVLNEGSILGMCACTYICMCVLTYASFTLRNVNLLINAPQMHVEYRLQFTLVLAISTTCLPFMACPDIHIMACRTVTSVLYVPVGRVKRKPQS